MVPVKAVAALICVAAFLAAAHFVGIAIGHEAQDRVLFTQNGITLDCRRDVSPAGDAYLNDCEASRP